MRVLVVGGAGSGKSAYAERLACGLSRQRTYVATMEARGDEARTRIARHRRQRSGLGFRTVECTRTLPTEEPCEGAFKGVVLLEDLGNLAANALFSQDGGMRDPNEVLVRLRQEASSLSLRYQHAVVVGNEVGSEGTPPYDETLAWVRLMGALCCALAAEFDAVVEVTSGIPTILKGSLGAAS